MSISALTPSAGAPQVVRTPEAAEGPGPDHDGDADNQGAGTVTTGTAPAPFGTGKVVDTKA